MEEYTIASLDDADVDPSSPSSAPSSARQSMAHYTRGTFVTAGEAVALLLKMDQQFAAERTRNAPMREALARLEPEREVFIS